MDNKQFFKNVYRGGSGRVVIVTPNQQGKPTHDHWFSYPADLAKMVSFADANKTSDVWFSPNIFQSDDRTKKNTHMVSVMAADADTCHPDNFRVRPTFVVETSHDRFHAYWALDGEYDPNEIAKVNRRIAQVHKDQGCDIAFVNAAKLLRVPGTSNNKHPGDVTMVYDFDADLEYTPDEMVEAYPASEVPDAIEAENSDMPDGLAEFIAANRSTLLNGLPNSMGLRELLFGKYQQDKRSDVRYKLLCELYRLGMDDSGVMAIAWGAPSNKYNGDDSRGLNGLWAEAMKAKRDVELEGDKWDQPIDDQFESERNRTKAGQVKLTNFLSEEEQQSIRTIVNFIDEWVQWAGTKTDAPSEYHRASAMTILSAVFSEFAHATPEFAPKGLKLNLWFMVLGRSTKDRKSTSRSYMNDAFRALKTDEYDYSIGDDVTPGGISLALHDRANKATVYDRDEVQGFFKEVLGQSYMSGGIEVFTKLYDGWSGGRVRATGEKKIMESVPTSFIMFMMGILTETADVLTITNYKSGFLTRFNYVVGKRPDGYKAPPMKQSSAEQQGKDEVFDGLIKRLTLNRSFWSMRADRDNGITFGMRAENDAWERLVQFEADVTDRAEESPYSEIIGTTSARMIISTLKLAALLAMDDRSLTIKTMHVLQAIGYAGEWYDNAVTVASMVSESEWQRDVEKLEQFVAQRGNKAGYSAAYRNFPEKRPFEFDELVQALEARGVMTRTQAGSRWILETHYEE